MNMPLDHDPGNDPESGVVAPRMRPTVIVTVLPTADLNRFVRSATKIALPHAVPTIYPSRTETDGVELDPVDSVLRFPAPIRKQASR